MAKLEGLPAPEIILALRGTLDFYLWRGLAVVRSWPRKPTGARAPLVQQHIAEYSDYNQRLRAIAPNLAALWIEVTQRTTWTWHDAAVSAIYGNANRSS